MNGQGSRRRFLVAIATGTSSIVLGPHLTRLTGKAAGTEATIQIESGGGYYYELTDRGNLYRWDLEHNHVCLLYSQPENAVLAVNDFGCYLMQASDGRVWRRTHQDGAFVEYIAGIGPSQWLTVGLEWNEMYILGSNGKSYELSGTEWLCLGRSSFARREPVAVKVGAYLGEIPWMLRA